MINNFCPVGVIFGNSNELKVLRLNIRERFCFQVKSIYLMLKQYWGLNWSCELKCLRRNFLKELEPMGKIIYIGLVRLYKLIHFQLFLLLNCLLVLFFGINVLQEKWKETIIKKKIFNFQVRTTLMTSSL